ncbi:hypothetical protein VP01_7162g1, partial [Puccinia sorghi]
KQYLTARGTSTRFHPQYNLSAIQSLSESCFQQTFHMSWACFLNLLHLIEPDPVFYNQYQNPKQDNSFQDGYGTINLYTKQVIKEQVELSHVMQEEGFPGCIVFVYRTEIPLIQKPPINGNHYYDCKKRSCVIYFSLIRNSAQLFTNFHILLSTEAQFNSLLFVMSTINSNPIQPVIQDHAMIAIYSKTCRFLSLKNYLIKISSFWKTQLIQVISIRSQLIKGRNYLTIRMLISITTLNSNDLLEMRTQMRNCKEMKDTIMWISSCVVLINLLEDLKDQWNEIYEEDESYSAPVAEDDIYKSNDGIHGILHPITLAHFEESQ